MQQTSTDQAIQVAIQHHAAGRLAEAEGIYRQVLARQPNHPEVLYLLGTMARQMGRSDAAIQLIRKAAESAPNDAGFHLKLAVALQALRQLDEAVAEFSKAIQLDPAFVDAHFGLGIAFYEQRKIPEAIGSSSQDAIRLRPEFSRGALQHWVAHPSVARQDRRGGSPPYSRGSGDQSPARPPPCNPTWEMP